MNRLIPALCLSLLLASCGGNGTPSDQTPPLAGARIGGPFVLTDQNGRAFSDRDLAGHWRIMYFGYTFCPDVCPADVQNIGAALKSFEQHDPVRAKRVVPVFVSVDPERDTPAVLKQFVSAFHPAMVGLTGSPQAIAALAKAYGVYYAKQKPAPGGGYLVDHTRQAYLMDPQGKPVALLSADKSADAVEQELARWVK